MSAVRLHPFHFLKYIKYGLILCVIPILRAVLAFDIAAAWLAFTQDLLILLACGGILATLWQASCAGLADGVLTVRQGVLLRRPALYRACMVSAVEVCRPLWYRVFGAARLKIYFKAGSGQRRVELVLPGRRARQLARALVPATAAANFFEPVGMDRLIFVLLSANILATSAFSVLAVRRIAKLVGQDLGALALGGITQVEHLLAAFLPAGLSLLAAVLLFFLALSLLASLLRTYRFTATRSGGVLLCRGGLLTHTERRVLVSAITASTLRITPTARLLRRCPVYVSAGGFRGDDLPILALGADNAPVLQRLLPEFCPPEGPLCNPRRKSPPQYLWKPGSLSLLLAALLAVSLRAVPAASPLLGLLLCLALASTLCNLEGIFKEGFCKNANRTFTLSYCRGLTRHLVSLYTNDLSLTITRMPQAASAGRCDLRVHTPSRRTYHLRGVEFYRARALKFNL